MKDNNDKIEILDVSDDNTMDQNLEKANFKSTNDLKKDSSFISIIIYAILSILALLFCFKIECNHVDISTYSDGTSDTNVAEINKDNSLFPIELSVNSYKTVVIVFLVIFIILCILHFFIYKRNFKILILLLIFCTIYYGFIKVSDASGELNYHKPILYLYPLKDTLININFEKEDLLLTTYPKFNDEWNVIAKTDGFLYDKDNKKYYALYWDEKNINPCKFEDGFYVEGKDAIKFLEEKLSYIGLNDRERNEFIMYWLPILEKNGKSIVQFDLTDEIESHNKLLIEPKPDSLLRIRINIKKVYKKTNIKEQKLERFNRKGFSAVEWGGAIIEE